MNPRTVVLVLVVLFCTSACSLSQGVTRGFFAFPDHEHAVHVTSNTDYLVCIWARNIDLKGGAVQVSTPPSQFRSVGSTGPRDSLAMDVPPQTGLDLGCIGGRANETIDIVRGLEARIRLFITVQSKENSIVTMIRE
jgi:hypothetical protein